MSVRRYSSGRAGKRSGMRSSQAGLVHSAPSSHVACAAKSYACPPCAPAAGFDTNPLQLRCPDATSRRAPGAATRQWACAIAAAGNATTPGCDPGDQLLSHFVATLLQVTAVGAGRTGRPGPMVLGWKELRRAGGAAP